MYHSHVVLGWFSDPLRDGAEAHLFAIHFLGVGGSLLISQHMYLRSNSGRINQRLVSGSLTWCVLIVL